jgi:ribose transport system substrate-binding protein
MRSWRPFLDILVTVAVVIVLAGCAAETPSVSLMAEPEAMEVTASAVAAGDAPWTIALVMKTLTNPFFVEMEKGARQAEQDFGVRLIVKTGAQETSIEQQIAIVRDLIKTKVDAIVIAPADSAELVPVLAQAQQAGIAIINIDNQLDARSVAAQGMQAIPFISVDNEEGAYQSAKYISDQLDEPAEAIILEGIRTAKNAGDRKRGAERALGENPNITVVAQETANWKIDEAHDLAATLFEAHPDIRAVFAANDMMALGVIRYLEETGRSDVLVAGYDALEEAKSAIQTGALAATVDQQAAQQGYLGIEYAVKALQGKPLPGTTLIDTQLITKASHAP